MQRRTGRSFLVGATMEHSAGCWLKGSVENFPFFWSYAAFIPALCFIQGLGWNSQMHISRRSCSLTSKPNRCTDTTRLYKERGTKNTKTRVGGLAVIVQGLLAAVALQIHPNKPLSAAEFVHLRSSALQHSSLPAPHAARHYLGHLARPDSQLDALYQPAFAMECVHLHSADPPGFRHSLSSIPPDSRMQVLNYLSCRWSLWEHGERCAGVHQLLVRNF